MVYFLVSGISHATTMHCNKRVLFSVVLVLCLLGNLTLAAPGGGGGGGMMGMMGGGGGKHGGGSNIVELLAAGIVAKMLSEHKHHGCHHG